MGTGGDGDPPVRDRIIWLGRGSGRAQAKGTDVYNEEDILETARCYARAHPHHGLKVRGARLRLPDY
eukprot:1188772-Prorocentrum_minimum.AAC.1